MRFMWKKRRKQGQGNGQGNGNGKLGYCCKGKPCVAKTLMQLADGDMGVIAAVPPAPHLAALGLRPGKKVLMHAREKFQGPVIVEVEGRSIALGRGLGSKIMLEAQEASIND